MADLKSLKVTGGGRYIEKIYSSDITANNFIGNVTGNLNGTATNATSDALNNIINTTYAPLESPKFTGTPTADTATLTTESDQLATTKFVHNVVSDAISASDAMIYKGTIGVDGTITELPNSTAKTGWTYKVVTAGTYASIKCNIGDMIICLTDGSSLTDATWTVVLKSTNTTYTNMSLGNGYATCTTEEATTAKVATLSSYSLSTMGRVTVKFTNAVPANSTLNINSTGAKSIYCNGSSIKDDTIFADNLVTFIYDGTNYIVTSITDGSGTPGINSYYVTSLDNIPTSAKDGSIVFYEYEESTDSPVVNTETVTTSVLDSVSSNYAPIASPDLIGTPTAPTADSGSNTTQIATTEFVQNEFKNIVSHYTNTTKFAIIESDLVSGSSFTVPLYIVGMNNLFVYINGSIAILGKDYNEVGKSKELSAQIRFINDLDKNTEIYCVVFNITDNSENSYNQTQRIILRSYEN